MSDEDYSPYKDRASHDLVDKLTPEFVRIDLSLKKIKGLVDEYITENKIRRREDDK